MRRSALFAVSALWFAACGGISTEFDYDPGVDFDALKTYAWMPGSEEHDVGMRKLIERETDAVLQAKGLRESSASPDFRITATAKLFTKPVGVGHEDHPTSYGGGTTLDQVSAVLGTEGALDREPENEGTLVLYFLHPDHMRMLWKGVATKSLRGRPSPEERTKQVRAAIEKLLADFPPK